MGSLRGFYMGIKLYSAQGNLNPMPVMGSEAFVAFAKEWCDFAREFGVVPSILIDGFKRQNGCIHVTTQKNEKVSNKNWAENLFYWIGSLKGQADTSFLGLGSDEQETNRDVLSLSDREDFDNLEQKSQLSQNIVFTDLCCKENLWKEIAKRRYQKKRLSDHWRHYVEQKRLLEEKLTEPVCQQLEDTTRKMVYERSALVHRGLLGGYSL